MAPRHPAGALVRARRRGGAGDAGHVRRADRARTPPGRCRRGDLDVMRPLTGPVSSMAPTRRSARDRDRRRRAGQLRLHRTGAGVRLPARRVPRPVQGQLGHRRRLGDLGRPARRAHPGRPFMGTIGLVPGTRLLAGPRHGSRRCSTAAASSCRPRRRPPCRPTARSRRRRCGRSRPASRPATSTSSSWARAPGCSSRSTPGRLVLRRRRALRPGRLRDLRHGDRDARHPARPLRRAQGRGRRQGDPRPAVQPRRTTTCRRSSPRRGGSTPPPASR